MTESAYLIQAALTEHLLVFEMFTECPRSVDVESKVSNRGLFCQESRCLLERNGLCFAQSAKPTELSLRRCGKRKRVARVRNSESLQLS